MKSKIFLILIIFSFEKINAQYGAPGTLKWSFKTEKGVESSHAIGPDGTIYVGSWDGKLYAINPNGSLKWSFQTGGGMCILRLRLVQMEQYMLGHMMENFMR